MTKQRDYCLDALKMILIILVIYAHIPLLDGLAPLGYHIELDSMTWHSVKGIYAFHMPLFVFLSGYFTRKKSWKRQLDGSSKLIKLFLVFQIIDLAVKYFSTRNLPSVHDFIIPGFALWYLLCLFYWRMLIAILPQEIDGKIAVLISFILSLLIGFIPIGGELGFQRCFSFLPYFCIGHYYGKIIMEKGTSLASKITPPTIGLLLITEALIIVLASFNPRWLDVIVFPYSDLKGVLLRFIYLGYSLFLSLLMIVIFKCKKNWDKTVISSLGSDTLFFYLLHPYILLSIVYIIGLHNVKVNVLIALAITVVTTFILMLLRKNKLLHTFLR